MLLLVLPCFSLLFAYWLSIRAQSTAFVEFIPDSPTDIEHKYRLVIYEKGKNLKLAQLVSLISCALIPFAILTQYTERSLNQKPELAIIYEKNSAKVDIHFFGNYKLDKSNKGIELKVYADGTQVPLSNSVFLPPGKGSIHKVTVPLPEKTKILKAELIWQDTEEHSHILKKERKLL
ncbi:MAG: hypothetical protein H7A25_12950 [Leptospiraceae bacterium]|nr:hypothetical protein [Leptospiraceae bacterium]MCP5500808.1 hypothetical protein [Leptospiraceae bacterium]